MRSQRGRRCRRTRVPVGARDQKRDLRRIELFVLGQPTVGIATHAADQISQFVADDAAADRLVRLPEAGQKMRVEKMAEGPVADVVQQPGQPQQALDVAAAGHVGAGFRQAVVQRGYGAAGHVHDADDVLEARMLGRRENPPGGLQLMDLPQPLQPGWSINCRSSTSPLRQP